VIVAVIALNSLFSEKTTKKSTALSVANQKFVSSSAAQVYWVIQLLANVYPVRPRGFHEPVSPHAAVCCLK
jgi:hypothetical protein